MKKKQNKVTATLAKLLMPIGILAILLIFAAAVNTLDSDRGSEELRRLEDALRQNCVACYAAEGVYPPNVEYLEEHYGVQINKSKYEVYYDIFAENLMPDITVIEK